MSSKKIYLGNAFSLQMLELNEEVNVSVSPVCSSEVATSNFTSIIGHEDTASVLSSMLMMEVPFNRASVSLKEGDILYVAQLTGGRLPEGSTTLPSGFNIKFLKVTIS